MCKQVKLYLYLDVDPGFSKLRTKAQKIQITVKLISTEKLSEKQKWTESPWNAPSNQEHETQSTEESKVNSQESLRTAHDDFLVYLTLKTSRNIALLVINSSKITFSHWFCLNIPEEIMTQEDEEFMLDNFVTFFIAGEVAGLECVCGGLQIASKKVQICSLDWFCKLQHFRARDNGQSAGILHHGACETSRHTGEVRTVHSWWVIILVLVRRCLRFFPVCISERKRKLMRWSGWNNTSVMMIWDTWATFRRSVACF